MFINDEINVFQMSWEFRVAEEQHCDALPKEFDDAIYIDVVMLFFGL